MAYLISSRSGQNSISFSRRLDHTLQEPEFQVDDTALYLWKHDQLENAEELLTAVIMSESINHHVLANRALVRARLRQWDEAILDAEKVIIPLLS